jgi:hypothetical protein
MLFSASAFARLRLAEVLLLRHSHRPGRACFALLAVEGNVDGPGFGDFPAEHWGEEMSDPICLLQGSHRHRLLGILGAEVECAQ